MTFGIALTHLHVAIVQGGPGLDSYVGVRHASPDPPIPTRWIARRSANRFGAWARHASPLQMVVSAMPDTKFGSIERLSPPTARHTRSRFPGEATRSLRCG